MSKLTRPFSEVALGEVIHAHGVPLEITATAVTYDTDVVFMVGTYRGAPWDASQGQGLLPFVRRDGDTWTIQRRAPYAIVSSYDDGATWNAPH